MIEKSKRYRTRKGWEVEIYATGRGGPFPVHGAFLHPVHGVWVNTAWTENGAAACNGVSDFDLIEVKPRIKGWVNLYRSEFGGDIYPLGRVFDSQEQARRVGASSQIIACIPVDFEEGEGL